jgi:hypothetical protein
MEAHGAFGPRTIEASHQGTNMDHTVSVSLDTDTLKQLDDLRRASPNVPSRGEVLKRLIWDAHAKVVANAPENAE